MSHQTSEKKEPKFIACGISFISRYLPPTDCRGSRIKISSAETIRGDQIFPPRTFSYPHEANDPHEECFRLYCLENETLQRIMKDTSSSFAVGTSTPGFKIITIIFP